jgi:hypothetical protein
MALKCILTFASLTLSHDLFAAETDLLQQDALKVDLGSQLELKVVLGEDLEEP